MLGLVLVAVSIGFNAVRYPVVWEMIGPAVTSESASHPVTLAQKSDNPPQQQPVVPTPPPIRPIEVKPAPEVGNKVVKESAAPASPMPASGAGTVAKSMEAGVPEPEAKKSLVPVAPVGLSNATGNELAGGAGIRRLPPVDPRVVAPTGQLSNGTIPVYPTTGIE
jgi:cytoskeletal protein RodZ